MKRCAVVLTVLAFGCAEEGTTALPGIELVQVFGQEFDGSEGQAIDTSIWNFDVGTGPNGDGWGNNELQYYTDSTDNISLDGEGNLRIRALDIPAADRGDFEGRRYSSARITTLDKFEQEYGRFEARMKMPSGRGLWPAFWMLGANFPEDGWP
ncbi:MAG: glycoside hydrolase family 16 protein, partial [Myxococcota bacterium]